MKKIEIRKIDEKDIPQIIGIIESNPKEAFNSEGREYYSAVIKTDHGIIIEENTKPIGFMIFGYSNLGLCDISDFDLIDDYKSNETAELILDWLNKNLSNLKVISCYVDTNYTGMLNFLESAGFIKGKKYFLMYKEAKYGDVERINVDIAADIIIRNAKKQDIQRLVSIKNSTVEIVDEKIDYAIYYSRLIEKYSCLVAEENQKIIAYVAYEINPHGIVDLEDFVVIPEYRRKKIASLLAKKTIHGSPRQKNKSWLLLCAGR